MGTFNVINQWIEKGNTKRIAQFESQGMCPECHGKGFNMSPSELYTMNSHYDCRGCNGSGSFSDWVEIN